MEKMFFSCEEAATLLGVTKGTIYKWCQSGKLKSSKPNGGKVLIRREAINELLEIESDTADSHEQEKEVK